MKSEKLLFFYKGWISLHNPEELKIKFETLLTINGFELFNFVEHYFTPHGYTCLWLLGESHLAIHTFPEFNKSFFELCSCSKPKLNSFKKSYKQLFDEQNK